MRLAPIGRQSTVGGSLLPTAVNSLHNIAMPATPVIYDCDPGVDDAVALFEVTQAMTETAGLPAYEISNHARPGSECRHNLT